MTRQQQWAKRAYERVAAAAERPQQAKYATMCMKMPSLIQQAGLVQALHFVKRKKEFNDYLNDLATVVGVDWRIADSEALCKRSREEKSLATYMALTRDTSMVALWFRRFAQAELKGDERQQED